MPRPALSSLRAAGLALVVLIPAATAFAGDAPRPAADGDAAFARKLLAARRANAEAQHAGRSSVWMAISRPAKPAGPVAHPPVP